MGRAPELLGAGLEAGDELTFDRLLDEPLDVPQEVGFFGADERNRDARAARPTGATNAVYIVFGHVGDLVVDDVGQLLDVDPTRRDVGRHENPQAPFLELGEHLRSVVLALVAVNRAGRDAVFLELLGEAIGPVFGPCKDQDLVPVTRLDQVREQRPLVVLLDRMNELGDELRERVAGGHRDLGRVVQEVVGERADLVGEGRREEEVLTLGRQLREDTPDVSDEAHVEHAVGFIEDEVRDVGEVDCALAEVVEEPARRCHQKIDALSDPVNLGRKTDAAEDDRRLEVQVPPVGTNGLLDLGGELTGRGEHQGPNRSTTWTWRLRSEELEQRQHKGRRLARARLGAREDVPTRENVGDGVRLDRSGGFVPLLGDGAA